MRNFKTKMVFLVLAAVLACVMCVNVCAGKFERNKAYSGHFTDVKTSDWYSASVKNAYEFGLMNGTATDKFNPKGMFTLAEAVTIAARMHSIYNGQGGVIPTSEGEWYMGAVDYCIENHIISRFQFDNYKNNATRAEMMGIMAAALPDDAWKLINNVEKLPDVFAGTPYSEDIFRMYNAGVIGGSDSYGIFQPYAYITRAEVSAIVSRMADDSLRLKLSLTPSGEKNNPVIAEPHQYRNDETYKYEYLKVGNGLLPYYDEGNRLWGYMDTNTKIVIPAKYTEVKSFEDGVALVSVKEGSKTQKLLIDTKGNVIASNVSVNRIYESVKSVYSGGKFALLKNGKFVTGFKYDSLNAFRDNYINAEISNGYGILDNNGKEIIPCKYEYGINFNDNYFWAKRTDGFGYDIYTRESKFIKTVAADGIEISNSGLMLVIKNGKTGVATVAKGEIVEPMYDYGVLSEDLVMLASGDRTALAGANGIIFELGKYDIKHVNRDVALVVTGEDEMVFADVNGIFSDKIKINPYHDQGYILAVTDEAIVCNIGGDYLFDRNLGKVMPIKSGYINYPDNSYHFGYRPDPYTGTVEWENGVIYGQAYQTAFCFKSVIKNEGVFETKDGKYVFFLKQHDFKETSVLSAPYATAEEAITAKKLLEGEAYAGYDVSLENDKPIAIYRNALGEIKTVIQYYKNGFYYDEIVYLGEDWFACRFADTWYLVHP